MSFKRTLLLFALSNMVLGSTTDKNTRQKTTSIQATQTRSIMHSIFNSFQRIFPLSIHEEDFKNPINAKIITQEIRQLLQNTHTLKDHVGKTSINNQILADNLSLDLKQLMHLYQNRRYQEARYVLHHISENCFSCHSRLSNTNKALNFKMKLDKKHMQRLNQLDLAHFQVIERKFDKALSTYEREFLKNSDLLASQSFLEYLKVSIRVRRDLQRPQKLIQKLLQSRQDKDIRALAQSWLHSIQWLNNHNIWTQDPIKTVRKIHRHIKQDVPLEAIERGDSLIYHIAATGILHQILDKESFSNDELSEIYYWLGESENFISMSCWITEYEKYYEHSIRVAPKSKWAQKSYKALQLALMRDFDEVYELNIPDDLRQKMMDLRKSMQTP